MGGFFRVEYPADFTAYPPNRKENMTDEATFVSPDGEVEFYIYSPQWNGKPRYLNKRENEIVEANKRKIVSSRDKIGYTHLTWRTYVDKHGRYNRAFLMRKTNCPSSNTEDDCTNITVFGIKFKNKASYNRYKKVYIKFKKSLEQYAD